MKLTFCFRGGRSARLAHAVRHRVAGAAAVSELRDVRRDAGRDGRHGTHVAGGGRRYGGPLRHAHRLRVALAVDRAGHRAELVLVVEVGRRLEDLLHQVQRAEIRLERVDGRLQSQKQLGHITLQELFRRPFYMSVNLIR